MAERRLERVAHLIQAELAAWFLRDAKDPRLQQVTVTGVRMTPDLRLARVYVRTLRDEDPAPTLQALGRATHALRGAIGRSLGLRVTPELRFEYDRAPDRARRIDDLLRSTTPPRDDEDET